MWPRRTLADFPAYTFTLRHSRPPLPCLILRICRIHTDIKYVYIYRRRWKRGCHIVVPQCPNRFILLPCLILRICRNYTDIKSIYIEDRGNMDATLWSRSVLTASSYVSIHERPTAHTPPKRDVFPHV
ncbi:hypothetical protein XA68_15223 [Ophiocordyceps unilateralis]|uniref:Uncharacterized protein n=1 Tax=Ophiocordyceps unilateralis TaxID=268505 RepID=A0A2A9P739_OPHUN|nr:hypothetical protein XA68_15223 [Ophiocordyceps unilateralis]